MTEETNALPQGYNLLRYQIDGVLGAGGFGITYKATHESLGNEVAIKEYFPAEWAYRDHNGTTVRANAQGQIPARSSEPPCYDWGLQRFLDEARILVQVNHPGVVRVRDYFTANGTAYIVMEYEVGESLSATLQRGGILPEPQLRRLLNDIMPALEAVHAQGYLHRDIKPSNLYIRASNGQVLLLDFGAARQALGRRSRSVTSVVTPGYSPIEQYVTVGEDYGPWTDIYATGAVLYRCITGMPPIEAPGRVLKDPVQPAVEMGAGLYSTGLLRLVDQAIAVRPEDRFQTIAAMREALQTADLTDTRADLSQLPPLDPNLLDQVSVPSFGKTWDEEDSQRPPTPRSRPTGRPGVPSRPSQRTNEAASTPGARRPREVGDREPKDAFEPASAELFSARIRHEDADGSLPLLETIWEQLDELAPPAPAATEPPAAAEAAPAPLQSSEPLLKHPSPSALEHLKKVSTIRRIEPRADAAAVARPAGLPPSNDQVAVFEPTMIGPRPLQWSRLLIIVFTVLGLSGIGLLAYQAYDTLQQQRQQEAVELQKYQQAEAVRLAQEQAKTRDAEVVHYLEQARNAINAKDWTLAANYLDRAAALNPDHAALATVQAELVAAERSRLTIKTYTENALGLDLHWMEGGCFEMGSPATERDRGRDEASHHVCVKSFWMSKTEITNAQFRRFKPNHDSGSFQKRSLNEDTQPAVNLNWEAAKAFAEWLSWEVGSGQRFRLPTEAEWEYAARANTTTRYPWGNDIDPRHTNFSDRNDPTGSSIGNLNDGYAVTAPVRNYRPNALGLHDMAGNVWEWTCSDYNPNYGGDEQRCSTLRPNEGQRVVRGGSWASGAGDLRVAKRLARKPDHRDAMTGFRVIREDSGDSPAPASR